MVLWESKLGQMELFSSNSTRNGIDKHHNVESNATIVNGGIHAEKTTGATGMMA